MFQLAVPSSSLHLRGSSRNSGDWYPGKSSCRLSKRIKWLLIRRASSSTAVVSQLVDHFLTNWPVLSDGQTMPRTLSWPYTEQSSTMFKILSQKCLRISSTYTLNLYLASSFQGNFCWEWYKSSNLPGVSANALTSSMIEMVSSHFPTKHFTNLESVVALKVWNGLSGFARG